jgi:mRNA-degrading endonuclease RelE of RelBE toxin-antitoxin system/Mrp family chromosome partitioning ATPase
MEFRIADTFTASLARLTAEEQKAVKTTAFDLQIDPSSPGMSFHKLDKARDKNFWSVRVTRDIRLIVHRTENSLLLCYVDHHDKAYEWAERRKLEIHPQTGAAQLVEIRETVQEYIVPRYVPDTRPIGMPPLFANVPDADLLKYGVPLEWLGDVRKATEDTLLVLVDHLPGEAAEALLELATGGKPRLPQSVPATVSPFDHPDAQRRFRVMPNVEELQRALDAPWEKWTVFLHPEQRQLVQRTFNGPARVTGSAGTGKTIVALHRAAALARTNADSRILLTTFSESLANALRTKLKHLVSEEREPRLAERMDVYAINTIGLRLYRTRFGRASVAADATIREIIQTASAAAGKHPFSLNFLLTEWEQIVDARQLGSWEDYRDVARLGRKTRLPEQQRRLIWSIMESVRAELAARNQITYAGVFTHLANTLANNPLPFDFVVVDEAQDIGIAHLRFLAALGAGKPNSLFFAGDLGQRIFQQPFSWKALGVDVRGRSHTLRVNYRTSHQIRMQADRLLAKQVADLDGNTDERGDTVSVFNGPAPVMQTTASQQEERDLVGRWLNEQIQAGLAPHEIGVFVRSTAQLERAKAAVEWAGIPYAILDEHVEVTSGQTAISTMQLAKGLEFRAVAVMACDDEVIPLQERIEAIGEDSDLEEVYNTERHLLYVACTRAHDHLLITSVEPASEFLDDLQRG